ncbi:hypothetical protein GCM10008932_05320 [Alkalibacterium iburiense]|uniref:ABC transmembrane type-2 domain-containing protein n=1 Tax=Alkalibacterium iburiense TaxID=290589 RepID=A0ABP3GXQ2_9LACT
MWTIFKLQWQRLFKEPVLVLLFLGLSLVFVYLMGGMQGSSSIVVNTYSEELSSEELTTWIDRLNEEDTYDFVETDYESVYEALRMNETPFALELNEDNYRFLIAREETEVSPIIQYVDRLFTNEQLLQEVRESEGNEVFDLEEFLTVNIDAQTETASSNQVNSIHILTGMSLYFTIYSVLFLMMNMIEEKNKGTWNRLIFSPISKTQIYLGQLLHYWLVGIGQIILTFTILQVFMGLNLGNNYIPMLVVASCFVLSIVSLGILIMGIIETPQQLNVIIPIVATGMAMIGGAFWPVEIVSNSVLRFLSRLMPIKYGMEGLRGAILQEYPLSELGEPIVILLLMSVFFMGIGLNLMERVSEKRSL